MREEALQTNIEATLLPLKCNTIAVSRIDARQLKKTTKKTRYICTTNSQEC